MSATSNAAVELGTHDHEWISRSGIDFWCFFCGEPFDADPDDMPEES